MRKHVWKKMAFWAGVAGLMLVAAMPTNIYAKESTQESEVTGVNPSGRISSITEGEVTWEYDASTKTVTLSGEGTRSLQISCKQDLRKNANPLTFTGKMCYFSIIDIFQKQ